MQVGRENMVFHQGPFTTFCIPALTGPYTPDITVLPSDTVCQYLCIHRDAYRRAQEVNPPFNAFCHLSALTTLLDLLVLKVV